MVVYNIEADNLVLNIGVTNIVIEIIAILTVYIIFSY